MIWNVYCYCYFKAWSLNACCYLIQVVFQAGLTVKLITNNHVCRCKTLCNILYISDELYRKYEFLENLLNRDFIFMPGHTKQVSFIL